MRAMIDLVRDMTRISWPWKLWLGLLILVNMIFPLVFISSIEGQAALVSLFAGFVIMTLIHRRKGYVRLLGAGHVFWVVLVPWLFLRAIIQSDTGVYNIWLIGIIAVNSLSLVIDASDVWRYLRGEKNPLIPMRH